MRCGRALADAAVHEAGLSLSSIIQAHGYKAMDYKHETEHAGIGRRESAGSRRRAAGGVQRASGRDGTGRCGSGTGRIG